MRQRLTAESAWRPFGITAGLGALVISVIAAAEGGLAFLILLAPFSAIAIALLGAWVGNGLGPV